MHSRAVADAVDPHRRRLDGLGVGPARVHEGVVVVLLELLVHLLLLMPVRHHLLPRLLVDGGLPGGRLGPLLRELDQDDLLLVRPNVFAYRVLPHHLLSRKPKNPRLFIY
jgi:hypothetical protein